MVHLISIGFFAGLLVGLALLLQLILRDNWQDMVAAFMGRPVARRTPRPAAPMPKPARAAPVRVAVARLRMRAAA